MEGATWKDMPFKPQKENVYNLLLPYADKLDEESMRLYVEIKTNLVKAFLAREMKPGCALWSTKLHKYIKIYGYKFSKEDHIAFIKLLYELVVTPNQDASRISRFGSVLITLLKKKELLSRDDLQLDWRPLYDLRLNITRKSKSCIGMYRFLSTLESVLTCIIKHARIYFPVTCTQEILDELRPKLCPYSPASINAAIEDLQAFLPIVMKPEETELGYQLWFKEFMDLWERCHNGVIWENNLLELISQLSSYNIGYIDWTPYVPIMFSRFIRTLQLPVSYRQRQSGKIFRMDINAMTLWIVSALGGPTDTVFVHLEKLMQTISSYYHSANLGRWTPKIRDFVKKMSLNFINRIHYERFKRKTWEAEVPKSHQLGDEDITRFVLIMKPCLEHMVYSTSHQEVHIIFNYFSTLRPNIIIPMLVDKLYASMESLTEPHKLTSTMLAVASVARQMVQGKNVDYPEGPTHVVPLLMNLLPGIDPNDIRKCFMTFNFIVQFVNLVPLINSSEANQYYDDLTEEEHAVCESTANFEDFVLQFFDRLCSWVESNSLETTRMEQNDSDRRKTKTETMAENALVSVISAVLTQCSPEIFSAALRKVHNFATTRIFEIKVSGKMVGIICQSFGRINPEETAKLFIPHICDIIEGILNDNKEILTEENLDGELLYNIMLLSEIVDINSEILNYIDRITGILDCVLHMTAQQGILLGCHMLNLIMTTLTFTQPKEYRSSTNSYESHIKDYLSIRDWGKAGKVKELNIKWYFPGEKEIACVQKLISRYLVPQLELMNQYASGEVTLNREALRKTFKMISACFGCHTVMPVWEEPDLKLVESVLEYPPFEIIVGCPYKVYMPDGSNIKKAVADAMHNVQNRLLEIDEGDIKSLHSIINIYDVLLFNKFRGRDFEFHWKNFHTIKQMLEDRLHKNKMHLRHVLIDRAMLQQEMRNEIRTSCFTQTHKQIMFDLFELSVSRYSEIRCTAQTKLFHITKCFPFCGPLLKSKFVETLQLNTTEHHERFKGCLYILLGPKNWPLITRPDWDYIRDLWPLLVKSQPSEKLSIVNLMDAIIDTVYRTFPAIGIDIKIEDKSLEVGYELAKNLPTIDLKQFENAIQNGPKALQLQTESNLIAYKETLDLLLEAAVAGNLHWRNHLMAVHFLKNLVHPDIKYNAKIVRFFLHSLISESIKIRKIALKVLLYILMQNKPSFKKIATDLAEFCGCIVENGRPGIRNDNKCIMYKQDALPKTENEWNKAKFIHDSYTGFYCWPKVLKVYASCTEQPHLSDHIGTMCPQQKEIYSFFTCTENVDSLIKYYSLEERKGNDRFNSFRFLLFKNLFKIYEDAFLDVFLPRIKKLVDERQESSQRCAAEIVSGLISSCKHWNFVKVNKMWDSIIPVLRTAFNNLSEENLNDWASALSMGMDGRDSRKYYRLLEFLSDNPLNESTSFLASSRIYILQFALNHQLWRNEELIKMCLDYFKKHFSHPFQNVRDKISWCLTSIFSINAIYPNQDFSKSCNVPGFFTEIMPTLNELFNCTVNNLEANNHILDHSKKNSTVNNVNSVDNKEELIRLFKVVSKYVTGSVTCCNYTTKREYYKLLPLASVLQNTESDEELSTICTNLIAVIGNTLILESDVPDILDIIKSVAKCPFWSARAIIAEFIPVFVFHNMSIVISNVEWVIEFQKIALELLQDTQPEVRIKASHAISGFLHCKFICSQDKLLTTFKKMASTKLKSKSTANSTNNGKLNIRHAGVLGLCSYISAHPYDVPDFLPQIFEQLGSHLNDPQPIPTTIRKTLGDFKRTHHANWEDHKLKFTENELSVLSDLSVPPSYYA